MGRNTDVHTTMRMFIISINFTNYTRTTPVNLTCSQINWLHLLTEGIADSMRGFAVSYITVLTAPHISARLHLQNYYS